MRWWHCGGRGVQESKAHRHTTKERAAFFTEQTIQTKCDKWAESHKYSSSPLPPFDYIVLDGIWKSVQGAYS